MSERRSRRRKANPAQTVPQGVDYRSVELRDGKNITSHPILDSAGRWGVSDFAAEFFLFQTFAKKTNRDKKQVEHGIWLDRAQTNDPLRRSDRALVIEMLDVLDRFIGLTAFGAASHDWHSTIMHQKLRALKFDLEQLENGVYPEFFYPDVSRPPALATKELFTRQVEVARLFFSRACDTEKQACRRMAAVFAELNVKGFSEDKLRRMSSELTFSDIKESFFRQLLPFDFRFPETLEIDALPHLEAALYRMADGYKRRKLSAEAMAEKARAERYCPEELRQRI